MKLILSTSISPKPLACEPPLQGVQRSPTLVPQGGLQLACYKAFDSVYHNQSKLALVDFYFTGSKLPHWGEGRQRVGINGCHSSWANVKSSVPRGGGGSLLLPILFLIYLEYCSVRRWIKAYIDLREGRADLQRDMDNLCEWLDLPKWTWLSTKIYASHASFRASTVHTVTTKKTISGVCHRPHKDVGVTITKNNIERSYWLHISQKGLQ